MRKTIVRTLVLLALVSPGLSFAGKKKIKQVKIPVTAETINITVSKDCSGSSEKKNINDATLEEIAFVPGMSVATATTIFNYITEYGDIFSCNYMDGIPGVSSYSTIILCDHFDVSAR